MIFIAKTEEGKFSEHAGFIIGVETFERNNNSQFRTVWYKKHGGDWSNLVCIASVLTEEEAYNIAIFLQKAYRRGIPIFDVGGRELELLPSSISLVEIDQCGRITNMRALGI